MISLHVKKTTIMIKKKKDRIFLLKSYLFFFFPEKSLNPEAWDKFIIFFSDHPKLNFKPSKRSPTTNQFNLKYVKKKKASPTIKINNLLILNLRKRQLIR